MNYTKIYPPGRNNIRQDIRENAITALASQYELCLAEGLECYGEDEHLAKEIMKEVGKRMENKAEEIFKLIFPRGLPKRLINYKIMEANNLDGKECFHRDYGKGRIWRNTYKGPGFYIFECENGSEVYCNLRDIEYK